MVNTLTERQKHILHVILETDEEVRMYDLVRRLQVSRRTIQRDISAIQLYLESFNLVIRVSSQNVILHGNPDAIARMLQEVGRLPNKVALTPKDRELHLVMDLLMERGPSKLGYYGRQLNVTSANLSQKLNDVSAWLRSHGLHLIRRRGYGVEVQGDEAIRREAIAELIYDQVSLQELMTVFRQTGNRSNDQPVFSWFSKWFRPAQVGQVRLILLDELADLNPPLDEASFYGFMLHVLLSIVRIEQGSSLSTTVGTLDSEAQNVQLCSRIIQRLLPQAETCIGEASYLAKHLRGAKVLMTEENRVLPMNMASMDLAYQMVKHLETTLDLSLLVDRDLIVNMAQHLEPAIHRMTAGLLIRNPLLEEIKRLYPSLFDAMRQASRLVLSPYGLQVPDSEVGYLTMHLGAAYERQRARNRWSVRIVCLNGMSSAELLASRIRKEFPQIEIVSVGALHEQEAFDCDFVIATVPIEEREVPIVTVSPFLSDKERRSIQTLIDGFEETELRRRTRARVKSATEQDLTQNEAECLIERLKIRHISASDIRDVITQTADDIGSSGDLTDGNLLKQAILRREQAGSIVLPGKRLCVLHARTTAVSRCQVVIYRLQPPITVLGVAETEEPVDTVLVLLAPEVESFTMIRLLGKLSSSLVMDSNMVEVLRSAPISDVMARIRQTLYQTEE